MLEIISSVLNNYKTKIRNPFLGTLVSVWLIRNWVIVYSFFSFDRECTMQDKINYIHNYFEQKEMLWEIFLNVSISFGILIFTFILLSVSRFMTDGFYKIVEPFIMNKVDKNTIFTTQDKNRLEKSIEEKATNIVKIRNLNSELENQNTALLSSLKSKENEYNEKITVATSSLNDLEESLNVLKNKHVFSNKIVEAFDDIILKLDEHLLKDFHIYINHRENINKNDYLNFSRIRKELLSIGILAQNNDSEGYSETKLGNLFIEYYKENAKHKEFLFKKR